jgi:tetratricopeptide (TPR) repeat protein
MKSTAASPSDNPSTPAWPAPVVLFLPFLAALLAFSKVVFNDFVYFDDHEAIWNNPALQNPNFFKFFSGQNLGMYAPVTWMAYAVGQALSGEQPWGYHLLSVLLHAANALLLCQVLRTLLRRDWPALAAALLFAVHPIQTEAVAWAAALSALLFTTFYLGSWLAYVRWAQGGRPLQLALSLGLFLVACLAKSAAVTLPLLLLACDALFFREKTGPLWPKKMLLAKLPYLLVALAFGLYTFSTRDAGSHSLTYVSAEFSLLDRFFMVCQTALFYVGKMLLPIGLAINYPFLKTANAWPWHYYAAPLLWAGIAWAAWRHGRHRPEWLFALALYLLPLSIMLPLQTVGRFELRADRYVYLSCAGIFLMLAFLLEKMPRPPLRLALLALLVVACALLAQPQIGVWRKDTALFQNCVDKQPRSAFCQCNLAYSMAKAKDFEGAVRHYTETERLDLDGWKMEVHNGRGLAYLQLRKVPEALADFEAARRAGMRTPELASNRGRCLMMLQRFPEALAAFNESAQLGTKSADTYFYRGFCQEKNQNQAAALQDYTTAIQLNPEHMAALVNRGFLQQNARNFAAAIEDYTQALRLNPQQPLALNNRAAAYLETGAPQKALEDATKAIQADPSYPKSYETRAKAYLALGKPELAQADFNRIK